MFVLDDNCIFIDVDDTLILSKEGVLLEDYSEINHNLIQKIREWKDNNRVIIVWTSNSGGVGHAVNVINRVGIRDEVDYVMPKPVTIVDDDHLEYYNIIDPRTLEYK